MPKKKPVRKKKPVKVECGPFRPTVRDDLKGLTKEERHQFDEQVAGLRMVQGTSFKAIADQLGCSKSTAHAAYVRYMQEYRNLNYKNAVTLMGEYHARLAFAWRHHLAKYAKTQPKGKQEPGDVSLLKTAMDIQNSGFDRLQSAGFLPKIKERFEHSTDEEMKLWYSQFFTPIKKMKTKKKVKKK